MEFTDAELQALWEELQHIIVVGESPLEKALDKIAEALEDRDIEL